MINGGGQERGLRSGTLPPAQVIGLGMASQVCYEEMENDNAHITRLHNKLKSAILTEIP
jgi:cysteine desulfurase